MTEIQIDNADYGHVHITDEVIAIIAGTAAMEIEGVVAMASNLSGDIALILGRRASSKGVSVKIEDNNVFIGLNLLVKFGFRIQDICANIQSKVKASIENMTGLNVEQVNINIMGVYYERVKKRKAQ